MFIYWVNLTLFGIILLIFTYLFNRLHNELPSAQATLKSSPVISGSTGY